MESATEFRITGPGYYKTRGGAKVEIAGRVESNGDYPWLGVAPDMLRSYSVGGAVLASGIHCHEDIVAPWVEPRKGTIWVNIYNNPNSTGGHSNRADADQSATDNRLACIQVDWIEGQGL